MIRNFRNNNLYVLIPLKTLNTSFLVIRINVLCNTKMIFARYFYVTNFADRQFVAGICL